MKIRMIAIFMLLESLPINDFRMLRLAAISLDRPVWANTNQGARYVRCDYRQRQTHSQDVRVR